MVFNTSPYAYTNKQLFAGKHITKIGIPVKTVQALDGEQNFTLSVVKTTADAYAYVSQNVVKLLFVFPPDQTFGGKDCTTDFGYGTLADFRAAFISFCQANDVPYLDLGETEFDSAKHSGDGVHPNAAGHSIIAEAIYEAIT